MSRKGKVIFATTILIPPAILWLVLWAVDVVPLDSSYGTLAMILGGYGAWAAFLSYIAKYGDYLRKVFPADSLPPAIQPQSEPSRPSAPLTATTPISSTPHTLDTAPPPPTLFVGRSVAMAEMRARLVGPAATTVLTAVRGWPGVGKTTLAAALAHDKELGSAFPDGVLWAPLGPDADPIPVLGSWLTALGVDPRDMPTIEERSSRLAALLRNRRMLLIVDDVWDAAQARPFGVAAPKCRTLITTRHPKVARDLGLPNRHIYRLEVLSPEASLHLLASLAPDAVAMDREGTLRLARELEGLPLALKVAGGLLAAEVAMDWGIGDLLRELAEGTRLLLERAPADLTNLADQTGPTVAVLLARSTDRLDDVTRDRFALLGAFVPKPATFDGAAVGAVWQVEDPKPTLRLLVDRGLLEPAGGGRFQMHALLAAHARALCDE